jgi:hypothetical protein
MIDKNTKITSLFSLSVLLRAKLVLLHFDILGDLLNYKVEEFFELEGITTYDVACIIELLNSNNYHILGEELLNISDFYDDKKFVILKYCDQLLKKRDLLRKENNLVYTLLIKNRDCLEDGLSI